MGVILIVLNEFRGVVVVLSIGWPVLRGLLG